MPADKAKSLAKTAPCVKPMALSQMDRSMRLFRSRSAGAWWLYAARRLLAALPILLGVTIFSFVLMRLLPGDPASYFISGPNAGPAEIQALREHLGLDRSLPEQMLIYGRELLHGELGYSLGSGQPVARDLWIRLPASLELTAVALLLALFISLPLGVAAALRPHSWIDHAARLLSTLSIAMPAFVSGILLIYLFYSKAGWVPAPAGRIDLFIGEPPRITGFLLLDSLLEHNAERFSAALAQMILPAATMALFALGPITRITRAGMLASLGSDYIRAARALGLPQSRVVYGYALRNALIPVVTTLGVVISYMLGANVLVEKVFAWPGIGSYALDAAITNDYAPVQGFILIVALLYVLLNLAIDLLYGLIDPRMIDSGTGAP